MTDQRFYHGPCKVREIPPGVFGEDEGKKHKLGIKAWGKAPTGYETAM